VLRAPPSQGQIVDKPTLIWYDQTERRVWVLTYNCSRSGIIVYLEHQSVCPVVEIRFFHPIPLKRGCLPPWTQRVRGRGDPIRTTG
jgi:hypothetical protein